ncbi:MAG: hypothetical protein U0R78_05460 [Nocardioidaceae bacterium]
MAAVHDDREVRRDVGHVEHVGALRDDDTMAISTTLVQQLDEPQRIWVGLDAVAVEHLVEGVGLAVAQLATRSRRRGSSLGTGELDAGATRGMT